MALSSEEAYLFVHIALREAAYQLWLPSDRARLHGVSLEILEAGADERLSAELAAHARLARQQPGLPKAEFERLRLAEVKHLCSASALAKRLHQGAQEIQIFRRLLECDDNFERNAQTELRLAQGLYNTGQLGETKAHYENLCAMDLPDSAMSVRAEALLGLAELAANRGEIKHAEDFSNESIMLSRSMGLGGEESLGLTRLANLYADSGRSELAEEMHLRAVKLARDAGRESVALSALGNLSNHYRVLGKFAESAQSLREVLEGFRKLGDMRNEGVALANLGRTYLMLDDLNQAETCLEQALKIQEQTGIQRSIAFALGSLAELWIRRGKLDAALAALVRTADLFEEAGAHMHRAGFRSALAGLHLLLGERERAQEVIEEVRTEFIQSGLGQYLAEYCDSVRLRIAADEAAMGDVTQRKTVKLGALPPKAAWLPIMKHILAGMRIASQNPKSVTAELTRRVKSGTALVAEIESAVKQGRPALVFRGHLPSEFTPEQCRALLEKCGRHSASAAVMAALAARAGK